jgi:hypothetical protein
MDKDYFSLMEFSAKWDPISSMLCQIIPNCKSLWDKPHLLANLIKSNVLVMGLASLMASTIYHGEKERNVYFYGGHDPEDYQHQVGDLLLFLIYILILLVIV